MAEFIVGPNNSSFFKKRKHWTLLEAIEEAKDGDTIMISSGYCYESDKNIVITKNIKIVGDFDFESKDKSKFIPEIRTGVFVRKGAEVTLKNVAIRLNREKSNALNVKDLAAIVGEGLIIENAVKTGENYPIIYADDNASIKLSKSVVRPSSLEVHKVYAKDAKLDINASVIYASITMYNTKFKIDNTTVDYNASNTLSIKEKSKGSMYNNLIKGGDVKDNIPCVFIKESEVSINSSTIFQPNYSSALCVINSTVNLTNIATSSAKIYDRAVVRVDEHSIFEESIFVEENSRFTGDVISIFGRMNGKINLYIAQNSEVKFNLINMGRLSVPPIKVERDSSFDVAKLRQIQYKEESGSFEIDERKQPVVVAESLEIEYFGEKTAFEKLDEMIGLTKVKTEVREFIALAQMNKLRREKGLEDAPLTLHSLFLGNPGTGKTTVARLIGKILYQKGLIKSDKFVETSRSDLVGKFIGHTAKQTREVLESALGGVLFVDEAYTLATGGENDFGREAINEILKFMEDNREDIVIIFAGYTKSMMDFLETNEGLRSRIPNHFNFEDYTVDQLYKIGLLELQNQGYKLNHEKYAEFVTHNYNISNDNSNGRWIRNQNEKLRKKLALRLLDDINADITTITDEDMESAKL